MHLRSLLLVSPAVVCLVQGKHEASNKAKAAMRLLEIDEANSEKVIFSIDTMRCMCTSAVGWSDGFASCGCSAIASVASLLNPCTAQKEVPMLFPLSCSVVEAC